MQRRWCLVPRPERPVLLPQVPPADPKIMSKKKFCSKTFENDFSSFGINNPYTIDVLIFEIPHFFMYDQMCIWK